MDPLHFHLMVNHLPVIGTVLTVSLLAYALVRKSDEVTKVSFGLSALLAVAGLITFLTGEPAEELVEGLAGISEEAIERHEEVASLATFLLGGVGLVSLAGLALFRRSPAGIPRWFATFVLLLALAPAGAMAYTANLGGQIRHPEIGQPRQPTAQLERTGSPEAGAASREARPGTGEDE